MPSAHRRPQPRRRRHAKGLEDEELRRTAPDAGAILASEATRNPSALVSADPTTRARAVEMLQSRAGNAAVQRAVTQAGAEAEAGAGAATTIDVRDVRFFRLPYLPLALAADGPARDKEARHLVGEFRKTGATSRELCGAVEYLQSAASTYGPAAVADIEAASGAIGGGLKGRRGDQLKAALDKYNEATPAAEAKVDELSGAFSDVTSATKDLEVATLGGQTRAARSDEAVAAGQLADLKKQAADAKQISDEVIGTAIEALTGNWKGAAFKVASLVGKHALGVEASGADVASFGKSFGEAAVKDQIGSAVQMRYADGLDRAAARLAAIRAKIGGLEDAEQLAKLGSATHRLKAAVSRLKAAASNLEAAGSAARSAHQNLYKELERLGPAGREAAAALQERSIVAKEAARATNLADQYQRMLTELGGEAGELGGRYAMYAGLVTGGREWVGPRADEISDFATANRWTCERLVAWAGGELAGAERVAKYLGEGSFMDVYGKGGFRPALDKAANPDLSSP